MACLSLDTQVDDEIFGLIYKDSLKINVLRCAWFECRNVERRETDSCSDQDFFILFFGLIEFIILFSSSTQPFLKCVTENCFGLPAF